MNCPNCQMINPEAARFCINCGTTLSISCTSCGTSLPAGARFCFNCGQPVRSGQEAESKPPAGSPPQAAPGYTDLLQRYIPKELLARLEIARSAGMVEGERRVVTILFCDVKGSTSAAANLDPEEWTEIMNGAFEHMIRPVYAFEGTVARLMGDGLLAFFGAPTAHEDDPQRAILAGLEIIKAVKSYSEEIKDRWGFNFEVRVGINTGLVVVGAVGSDLRLEYTALGDAINLAARMEQTAQPGAVQIAEPTYRLISPLFEFETISEVEVKGRDKPVRAYRVIAPRAEPGRLRGIEGLQAPLIGRDQHLASLLSKVRSLQEGSGNIVSLIGEAGLGKSRLVTELRHAVATDPGINVRWLEGRSLSYENATPYAPFINIFNQFFGLQPGQDEKEKLAHIQDELENYFPGRSAEIAPFFAAMLGLPVGGEAAERIKYLLPPMLRGQVFAHVAELVKRIAASQPLLLVLDDLHWCDPTSLDLLLSLLPLIDQAALLMIAAFRPRRQEPAWSFHETAGRDYPHRYQAIELEVLDQDQSRQLIASLLEIEDLPDKVRGLILVKSEGNPFFVEEIIRSLLDRELVVRQDGHWRATQEIARITIPDTLVGVITARLDRLEERNRRILQAASVLGREFSPAVLADLTGEPEAVERALPELQRRELLVERSRLPQRTYAFKHVLTQEAAYGSILLSNRRELHHRAAESLIARQPDQAAEIARHFLEARQPGLALPYLVAAGEQAARAYAIAEAIEHFNRAVELRSSAESLEPVRRAYEGLGNALTFTNRYPEARQTYETMLALAESYGDIPMQVSALNKLGSLFALFLGRFQEAEQVLIRSEELIRKHAENSSFPELALVRCQMCTAQADFENVVRYMSEVVQIGEEAGNQEHVVTGLEHVATSLVYMTRYDEALEKGLLGLEVARSAGDQEHEATLLTSAIPFALIRNGDFNAARQALITGVEIATQIGALFPLVDGSWLLAEISRMEGDYERALDYGKRSVEAALPLEGFTPFQVVVPLSILGSIYLDISPKFSDKVSEVHRHALRLLESPVGAIAGGIAWADLGFCAMTLGDFEIAEDSIQKGLNYPTMFSLMERPRLLAGAALLALKKGDSLEARRFIDEAILYADERKMKHVMPLISLTAGKVHRALGDVEKSLQHFEAAEAEALSLNMRPIVWQARTEAAGLLKASGQHEAAAAKGNASRSVVEEIVSLFRDPDLRAAYLDNVLEKIPG